MLTTPTVVSVTPASNSIVDVDQVVATFDQSIDPASANIQSVVAHGMQTGRLGRLPVTVAQGNTAVQLPLGEDLLGGQLVQVTVTRQVTNPDGESVEPFVWQFRTAALGGSGSFDDQGQTWPGARGPAALGDFNGDGDLDALIVGHALPVWLNQGDGQFVSSGQQLQTRGTNALALGDVDGDGDLDAMLAEHEEAAIGGSGIHIWLNDGTGMFTESMDHFGDGADRLALGDMDADARILALPTGLKLPNGEVLPIPSVFVLDEDREVLDRVALAHRNAASVLRETLERVSGK